MNEAELHEHLKIRFAKEDDHCEWKGWSNLKGRVSGSKGDDIASYVSAIANIEGGHLVVGVEDATLNILGISRFHDYSEENIRPRLVGFCTNLNSEKLRLESITTEDTGKTVWIFHIPKHEARLPVYAHGKAWQRIGESLVEMTSERLEAIRREPIEEIDWSAQIVDQATLADLDPDAIQGAREKFTAANAAARWAGEIASWDASTFLDKAKITAGGRITRTALLLLGKREAAHFLSPHPAQITWSLETEERAYEHFYPPFFLTTSDLHDRIRNVKQKLFPENELLPVEIQKYDARTILEGLHNCIAHQDYTMNERILVTENFDRLVFESAGGFYEGVPDSYLTGNVRPRRYRNKWLADAMVEVSMIDTMGYGIFEMTKAQMGRYLPLPDYTRSTDERVTLEVLGRPIDVKYSQLLLERSDLDIDTVILLDRVQKELPITDEAITQLRRAKLVEGRKPNIRVAASVAKATETNVAYTRSKGMAKTQMKELLLAHLAKFPETTRPDINELLLPLLPASLDDKKKRKNITNLLSEMKGKDETIDSVGRGPGAKWYLVAQRAGEPQN